MFTIKPRLHTAIKPADFACLTLCKASAVLYKTRLKLRLRHGDYSGRFRILVNVIWWFTHEMMASFSHEYILLPSYVYNMHQGPINRSV